MSALLRPLLVIFWYLRLPAGHTARDGFFYHDINTGNGNRESTCVLEILAYLFFIDF